MDKNREPDRISKYGTKFWYDDNHEYHNENGYPAIIRCDGYKAWYKHGTRHNENGPAEIYHDGYKAWYIDDEEYTEKRFKQYKIKNFINEE